MGYSVEKADLFKDKDRILEFWQRNFPTWAPAKFAWLYEENIYGKATCWTIRNKDATQALGVTAVFPRRFWANGRYVEGGITGDFAVDKRHRIVGPALQLQKAVIGCCERGEYEFLYGFPNAGSEPIQKRAGFKIAGSAARMVKVLKADDYVTRIVNRTLLSKLLSPIANIILRLFAKETRFLVNKRYAGEVTREYDGRFDDLWKKSVNNFTIIGERNSAFLKWKFGNCPYNSYKTFTLVQKDSRKLVGYVIYYVDNKYVHIADFLYGDRKSDFDQLIAALLKHLRHNNYHTVSVLYFGNTEIEKKLKAFNFSKRADNRNIIFYVGTESQNGWDPSQKDHWFFLEADND